MFLAHADIAVFRKLKWVHYDYMYTNIPVLTFTNSQEKQHLFKVLTI